MIGENKMNKDEFGKLLRTLREQQNLTQAHLADVLHVTTASVSKWETGKNLPNNDIQDRLCQFFHLTHDELHNPETTLSHLSPADTFSTVVKPAVESKEKPFAKKKQLFAYSTAVLVVLVVVAGILLFMHRKNDANSFSVYHVNSRYYFDEYSGEEIYEYSCVYIGAFTLKNASGFSEHVRQKWMEDNNVRKDINTLKISFYKNEQAALGWAPTNEWVYLFR